MLEAAKGKFLLRIDEVKGENELKREIDLLSFLRKHAFPCPHPMQDRMGRFYRNFNNRCVSLFKYQEGKVLAPARLKPSQLETIGHALGDLHVIGKAYKKGIDNRFSFERIADLYLTVRNRLPNYFRKICRTLDDEVEYLTRYLEGKLPKGVIHGDIFSDNLLFRGEKLTAMLDFDAACRGKFIFDIATAVNALCFVDGSLLARPLPLPAVGLRVGAHAVAGGMGRVSQRAAVFIAALHRDAPARFLSVAGGRQASRGQGLPRVLRSPARAAPRARRRDGTAADGDGDRLRLPQISEGQSDRAPPGVTPDA